MLLESLVVLGVMGATVWVAATRFVRSRGYSGWYLSYIGVGSSNPTWESLSAIKRSSNPRDQRTALRYWWALILIYIMFIVAFVLFAYGYMSGATPS